MARVLGQSPSATNEEVMQEAVKLPLAATLPNYTNLRPHELALAVVRPSKEDRKTLKESIRKGGIRERLWLYEDQILEGVTRYETGMEVGYAFSAKDFQTFVGTYEQAKAFVRDVNYARRHLTNDQKQAYALELIAENPNDSNRAIAKRCGLSHTTVAGLREDAQTAAEENVDKDYNKLVKGWNDLTEEQQERFVEEFKTDLRELLLEV
jgi:hypothetical protein